MSIIWTYDLENKVIYHPVVEEDDCYFVFMPSKYHKQNSRLRLQKNEHHLSRVIGGVEE